VPLNATGYSGATNPVYRLENISKKRICKTNVPLEVVEGGKLVLPTKADCPNASIARHRSDR
jgi:hypothetical protein